MGDNVTIVARRIKEQAFSVDEALFVSEPGKQLTIRIGLQLGFAVNLDLVTLHVVVQYHYPETPEDLIANIQVQNIFEISGLKRFIVSDSEIKLPSDTISRLVEMSVSHTRALLAKNLFGTVVQENVLPISDARQMAKDFFPNMFDGTKLFRP